MLLVLVDTLVELLVLEVDIEEEVLLVDVVKDTVVEVDTDVEVDCDVEEVEVESDVLVLLVLTEVEVLCDVELVEVDTEVDVD